MDLERLKFLSKVNKVSGRKIKDLSECWFYTGKSDKRDGYCRFQTDWAKENGCCYAHQASYKLFKDESYKPSREHPCSHLCEAPNDYLHRSCVNPDHLYIANNIAQNVADRDANRGSYQSIKTAGIRSGSSIFNIEQLEQIRKLREEGKSYIEIAKEYNCNRRTIERICLKRTYKND